MDTEAEDAAFAAEVGPVEAAIAAEKEAKELAKVESLRCACTYGRPEVKSSWARLVKNDGTVLWMLKVAPVRRTKAEQAVHIANHGRDIDEHRTRLRQAKLYEMRKVIVITKNAKDARVRRLAHHSKFIENKIKEEKAAKLEEVTKKKNEVGLARIIPGYAFGEEQEKKEIVDEKVNEAEMTRLLQKRALLEKREKERIAIKKFKDAQMARAVADRKSLKLISSPMKKDSSSS